MIIPNYLQKYIIKILCIHINHCNSLIEPIEVGNDYRSHESNCKRLTMSLCLVNKLFFSTVRNNLNVSVDFNYSFGEYSINKADNMTLLKLHFNHPENYYYQMLKGVETPMKTNVINEKIKELSSLEQIIFRNININSSTTRDLSFLNTIDIGAVECKKNMVKDDDKIRILEFEIDQDTTIKKLFKQRPRISNIFSLIINNCTSKEIILKSFELWSSTINQFYIVSHHSPTPFPWKSLSNNQYLSNILYYEIYGIELRLSNLLVLLKSSPQLKHLSFSTCFDKLVYLASKLQERKNVHLLSPPPEQGIKEFEKCYCNSVIFGKTNLNYYNYQPGYYSNKNPDLIDSDSESEETPKDEDTPLHKLSSDGDDEEINDLLSTNPLGGNIDKEEDEIPGYTIQQMDEDENENMELYIFKRDWKQLSRVLHNHQHLEYLHIGQECRNSGEVTEYTQNNQNFPIKFPTPFINMLSKLISGIVSLKKVSILGINSPQLFESIINNNKSISYYNYVESIMDPGDYKYIDHTQQFQSLIDTNPQILEYKYTRFVFTIQQPQVTATLDNNNADNQEDLNNILSFKDEVLLHFKKKKIN